ncbi:MAG: NAD(+)/NADH kinase [Nocardioidaceae bacterium]
MVNPIAGMGGAVALKGTDGVSAEALRRGARPHAGERATRVLLALTEACRSREPGGIELVTCSGEMGEDAAVTASIDSLRVMPIPAGQNPSAADTMCAAQELARIGVDLLLFAGGDGTARDIHAAVGQGLPVLGVPAGVKMQSAVFAQTPEAAGRLAARYLLDGGPVEPREVLDLDEAQLRDGVLASQQHGYLDVPAARDLLQHPKRRSTSEEAERLSVGRAVLEAVPAGALTAVGPGTTAGAVMGLLDLPHTLLGFDLVRVGEGSSGELVRADITSSELLAVADEAYAVIAPTGNQGALLGRGNQVLTPEVLRRLGDRLLVVAGRSRLAALSGRPLMIDLDDPEVEADLCGMRRILVGPGRIMIYPIARP